MAIITGTNGGVADSLSGTVGADRMSGLSGNDVLRGGRGDDTFIGGTGSDVLIGGLGADSFEFSAGHITTGAKDVITDFDLRQGDSLNFIASGGGQSFEVVSVVKGYTTDTTMNGVDLQNNISTGTDVTFTVRNSVTGVTQEIVLLDAWSGSQSASWDAYLATMGLHF